MVSSRLSNVRAYSVALLLALLVAPAAFAAASGALPQAGSGDGTEEQWSPAVASDGHGHVYVIYPQYDKVPDCPHCPVPNLALAVSHDHGANWQVRLMTPPVWAQVDPRIVVDPEDRRTVYAIWLQNGASNVIVAKSTDFGQSWSLALAVRLASSAVRPVLAVRGKDVYAGFIYSQKLWVSASHDGGITFAAAVAVPDTPLDDALTGDAVVDLAGNAFFAWTGYTQDSGGKINLYISKSSDNGQSWKTTLMDVSAEPEDCSAYHCEWGYLGAQITIAADDSGELYALWNASATNASTERVFLASSTTQGEIWSPKEDASNAPAGVKHIFPTITAGAAGNVRIGWLDSRRSPLWTAFYRTSTNGGATWSAEEEILPEAPISQYLQVPVSKSALEDNFR